MGFLFYGCKVLKILQILLTGSIVMCKIDESFEEIEMAKKFFQNKQYYFDQEVEYKDAYIEGNTKNGVPIFHASDEDVVRFVRENGKLVIGEYEDSSVY